MEKPNLSTSHTALLEALYDPSKIAIDNTISIERFRFDSERRIMDLSRLLWKYWPSSSNFLRAKYGDEYILSIAKIFSEECTQLENVEKGITKALDLFLTAKAEKEIMELVNYENIKKGVFEHTLPPNEEIKNLLKERIPSFRVARFGYDPINFEKVIQFYTDLHAPFRFIHKLKPDPELNYLAVYKREAKVFAINITNFYGNLLSSIGKTK